LQLKTLWHLVKSVEENLDLATYLQSAKTFGVPNVSILVKDEIYKYITGKSETCSQLVSAPKESETKRKRLADWGLEDVLASEQPVTSRMTALQNVHLNLEVKPLLQEVSALNLRDLPPACCRQGRHSSTTSTHHHRPFRSLFHHQPPQRSRSVREQQIH